MAKKKHGGAREGAGRKQANPEGKSKTMAASVPEALMDDLDAIAVERGWNRSRAVTEAIRRFVKSAKRQVRKT